MEITLYHTWLAFAVLLESQIIDFFDPVFSSIHLRMEEQMRFTVVYFTAISVVSAA